jgi:ribosomal protein S18 acetylase RimI-like enzyme
MKFLKSVGFERYTEEEQNFNLENYSEKLEKKAINIFAVNFNCDIAHLAFYLTSSSIFVSSLSVLPSWRKLGIGSELLKICTTIATSMGRAKIELETSRNNVEAINFYNKIGFEINNLEGSKRLALSKLISQPI